MDVVGEQNKSIKGTGDILFFTVGGGYIAVHFTILKSTILSGN